ncbi:pyridoxamine 5'-phosphate oxidase [Synergistales bacterium]|nr:pyridoxamine 5'-phosphate oxidase [Synergistales bacterium]GHV53757.1 pyridoxamine 5'-phosphate oxidase [Synergistales bacterium]
MPIDEKVKSVIEGTAFLSVITLNADGTPHPIITGKAEVVGDTVVFGIYKMETTQKNLKADKRAWVVAATLSDGPKGYRLTGDAVIGGEKVVFTPAKAEALI